MRVYPLLCPILASMLVGCVPLVAGGVAGGTLVNEDRRSMTVEMNDQANEVHALKNVDSKYSSANVAINSYDQVALITGEVPDQATKTGVENEVRVVPDIKKVISALTIGPNISYGQHLADEVITNDVRSHFFSKADGRFYPLNISVVTENKIVYLMGLVTHEEGAAAVQVARDVSQVRQVYPLFEYIKFTGAAQTKPAPVLEMNTQQTTNTDVVAHPEGSDGAPVESVKIPDADTPLELPKANPVQVQ